MNAYLKPTHRRLHAPPNLNLNWPPQQAPTTHNARTHSTHAHANTSHATCTRCRTHRNTPNILSIFCRLRLGTKHTHTPTQHAVFATTIVTHFLYSLASAVAMHCLLTPHIRLHAYTKRHPTHSHISTLNRAVQCVYAVQCEFNPLKPLLSATVAAATTTTTSAGLLVSSVRKHITRPHLTSPPPIPHISARSARSARRPSHTRRHRAAAADTSHHTTPRHTTRTNRGTTVALPFASNRAFGVCAAQMLRPPVWMCVFECVRAVRFTACAGCWYWSS